MLQHLLSETVFGASRPGSCDQSGCRAVNSSSLYSLLAATGQSILPQNTPKHEINMPDTGPSLEQHITCCIAWANDHCWSGLENPLTCIRRCREAAARERLAMLKSNDVGAYLKLVQSAKNSRLSQLLSQTDACLNKLAARLKLKSSMLGSGDAAVSHAPDIDGKRFRAWLLGTPTVESSTALTAVSVCE